MIETPALVALIVAGAAFLVAFLQTLLQYISSSENRNKCSTAAIGASHKNVRHRWKWSSWKMRIDYPLLDYRFSSIRTRFITEGIQTSMDEGFFLRCQPLETQETWDWNWRPMASDDSPKFWHVADSLSILWKSPKGNSSNSTMVTIKDLTWEGRKKFIPWRWKNPTWSLRPRASWAQILLALDIKDTTPLFLKRMDADTIPSSLDVPPQRIRLVDLGKLAFFSGFSSVTIDPDTRTFTATSPFATISTEEVQVLGKILRFEGDILTLHNYTSRCHPLYLGRAMCLALGQISFGKYSANGFGQPLEAIGDAAMSGMTANDFDDAERVVLISDIGIPSEQVEIIRGAYPMKEAARMQDVCLEHLHQASKSSPPAEARHKEIFHYQPNDSVQSSKDKKVAILREMKGIDPNILKGIMAKWQGYTGRQVPSILVLSTMASVHAVTCGFPSRAVLFNFIPWFRFRARRFYDRHVSSMTDGSPKLFLECPKLLVEIAKDNLGFARSGSHFLMCSQGASINGLFGWGTSNMETLYDMCSPLLQAEIVHQGEARALVTRDTVAILKHFDVKGWLDYFAHSQQGTFSTIRPLNMLFIQLVLLDMAIQYTIRDGWGDRALAPGDESPLHAESWKQQEGNVAFAITKSWRIPFGGVAGAGGREYSEWDLAGSLTKHADLAESGDAVAQEARIHKLADLLELRGLIWIFFMLCHPDSSDIYLVKDEEIELPMV